MLRLLNLVLVVFMASAIFTKKSQDLDWLVNYNYHHVYFLLSSPFFVFFSLIIIYIITMSAHPRPVSTQSTNSIIGVHYKVGKKIGEGSFGIIYEGKKQTKDFFSLFLMHFFNRNQSIKQRASSHQV